MRVNGMTIEATGTTRPGGLPRQRRLCAGLLVLLLGLDGHARVALEERDLVAFGVDARGEPPLSLDRKLVLGFAAELPDRLDGRVDVINAEAEHRTRLLRHRVCRARRLRAGVPVAAVARHLRV